MRHHDRLFGLHSARQIVIVAASLTRSAAAIERAAIFNAGPTGLARGGEYVDPDFSCRTTARDDVASRVLIDKPSRCDARRRLHFLRTAADARRAFGAWPQGDTHEPRHPSPGSHLETASGLQHHRL